MWAFFGWVFYKAWAPKLKNRLSPVVKVPASVAIKEQEAKYIADFNKAEITRSFITFDCKDGISREFEVPLQLFNMCEKGDHGTLLYRGTAFVNFEGARVASNLDEMYKRMAKG